MASACYYALFTCFLIIISRIGDANGYTNALDSEIARKHELWMAEHGRVYKDEAEKARRFEIFKENVEYIEDFNNAGKHRYTLGVNLFADLTSEEFLATYASGFKKPEPEIEESLRSVKYETTVEQTNISSIPASFDWRDVGAVAPVKFQMLCNCCWAMTAASTIESLGKIKTGVLYTLSTQQIIDCDKGNNGCKPGTVHGAYRYVVRNRGLTTEATYPYKDVEGKCDFTKEKKTVATINGYKTVARNEQALMAAASKDLQLYRGGIFHGSCGTAVNHAVTVIGYGESSKDKYWIVKNSWSSKWGENGYIRMEKDVPSPSGMCGITEWAVYPTM
ncbi:zingipain-2-like [Asparagus officinalis]|uniref:zingipain-2-like n=1 Tax=Asparagus officinalis TaxID=4686 RepID=UPI00098DE693|nr:zingipain-2-like [Asparagus officinalis]